MGYMKDMMLEAYKVLGVICYVTYGCEQGFSTLNHMKTKARNRL